LHHPFALVAWLVARHNPVTCNGEFAMSVSQNLLAFISTGSLPGKAQPTQGGPAESGQAPGASFADILSKQQPDDVEALIQLLGEAESDAADKLLEVAELAADGKNLPAGMEAWLTQLDELRIETGEQTTLLYAEGTSADQQQELTGLAEEWSQWLDQARQFLGDVDEAIVDAQGGTALAAPLPGATLTPVAGPFAMADGTLDSLGSKVKPDAGAASLQLTQDQLGKGERDLRQEQFGQMGTRTMTEKSIQLDGQQPAQRNLEMTPAAAEGKAAFAGKLAETLEALSGRQPGADKDSGEGLLRPGAQTQAAAQGALAARPVLAASQTLNVPFGQAGWGDAVMDKMMWMSSQNLRSVNIRLDPADLGPLEINIQTRGQEHQVQFVTQNPSVREALEAQMFRLREAFSQQGMNLVDVSVGDSAVDQQAHHNEEGAREGQRRGPVTGSQTLEADEAGMMLASAAITQAQSRRLVDYYA
jgi:flagellar hook-length control protein FliK